MTRTELTEHETELIIEALECQLVFLQPMENIPISEEREQDAVIMQRLVDDLRSIRP